MSLVTHNIMNNSICTLFDNILIDIHKFKSLHEKRLHGMWTFSGNQLGPFLKNIVKFTSTRT